MTCPWPPRKTVLDSIPGLQIHNAMLFPISTLPSPLLKVIWKASGCCRQRFISNIHLPETTHKPGRLQTLQTNASLLNAFSRGRPISTMMIFTRDSCTSPGASCQESGHFRNSFNTSMLWQATAIGMLQSALSQGSPLLELWLLKARAINWPPSSSSQNSPSVESQWS